MFKVICYIVAMVAEAKPFIERNHMTLVEDAFAPLPCPLYETEINGTKLYVVTNGQQHGSDLIGCEAASITTMAAIQKLNPDIIINSGTCGAFARNGAKIADVYIGNAVMFHDRRVPGDNEWDTQSLGHYPVWEGASALAEKLGMPMGKVTTGSSLDMQPCDEEVINKYGGQLKDMEGAAIGFVCSLYNKPVLYVKSVTDLCDSGADTYEEFSRNFSAASESLRQANIRIIEALTTIDN